VRFDLIVGRNSLTRCADKAGAARLLAGLLLHGGAISLAETIPLRAQRLYALVDTTPLGTELSQALRVAEEAIYANASDPMINWDVEDLREADGPGARPIYAQHLARQLPAEAIAEIRALFRRQLVGNVCQWHSMVAFLVAERAKG